MIFALTLRIFGASEEVRERDELQGARAATSTTVLPSGGDTSPVFLLPIALLSPRRDFLFLAPLKIHSSRDCCVGKRLKMLIYFM